MPTPILLNLEEAAETAVQTIPALSDTRSLKEHIQALGFSKKQLAQELMMLLDQAKPGLKWKLLSDLSAIMGDDFRKADSNTGSVVPVVNFNIIVNGEADINTLYAPHLERKL